MALSILDPDSALDRCGHDVVLLCFAKTENLLPVKRLLDRLNRRVDVEVIRVEPDEQAATVFQISRHPTFVLYSDGNEVASTLGTDGLPAIVARIFK